MCIPNDSNRELTSLFLSSEKTVRFQENAEQVFEVLHRSELTPQEHEAANYTEGEYQQIKAREKTLARRLASSGTVNDLGEADLGLETREDKFFRRQRVHECCMSVLLEQELQRETTGCNPEALAEVYAEYSARATQLAKDRAYQNALQIEDVGWASLVETIAASYDFLDPCGSEAQVDMEPIPYRTPCYATCTATPIEEDESPMQENYPSKQQSMNLPQSFGMPPASQAIYRLPAPAVAPSAFFSHYQSPVAQPWDVWAHHLSEVDGTRQ